MNNNLFLIEEFRKQHKHILVVAAFEKLTDCVTISVDRRAFEQWLDDRDRLEYEEVNKLGEETGRILKMTINQYWEDLDNAEIEKDLYEYIVISGAANVFDDIKNDLDDILYDYQD